MAVSSDALRALAIIGTVARAGLRFSVTAATSSQARGPGLLADAAAQAVTDTLIQLGPAFTKAGQLLAVRADLLPDSLTSALTRLYDDIPAPADVSLERTFRSELDLTLDDVFKAWDPVPIASASVAVVHRAWLVDGTPVAVKVLRPGIAAALRRDLRLLRHAACGLARLPAARDLPVAAMVEEVSTWVERQVDLRYEADAARHLREALTPQTSVELPRMIDELCGPSVLTMTYLEGEHGHRSPQPADRKTGAAHALLRAVYRMIFVDGLIHCDLHPGNILYMDDGRVGLLDFGFVARIDDPDRIAFARFFYAMVDGDGHTCAQVAIQTASSVRDGFDPALFEQELTESVRANVGASTSEFHVARFVTALFMLMRRHGVRGTTGFTMAILALVTVEGLVKDSGADVDFQSEARPYLLRASLRGAAVVHPDPGLAMSAVLADLGPRPERATPTADGLGLLGSRPRTAPQPQSGPCPADPDRTPTDHPVSAPRVR